MPNTDSGTPVALVVESDFPPPYDAPLFISSQQKVVIAMPRGYPKEIVAVLAAQRCPEDQQCAIRRALDLPEPVTAVQAARAAIAGLS